MIKLSHSRTNVLKDCGYYYKLYYIDKIRPTTAKSALFFGNAMDNALNDLLASKLKKDPIILDYKKTLLNSLSKIDINGEEYDAKTCTNLTYTNTDMDLSLLEASDYEELEKLCPFSVDEETVATFVSEYQTSDETFKTSNRSAYNLIGWFCLYRRGLMLLDAYMNDIYPTIEYVESIQEKVSLPNSNGDELTGIIDAIIKFKDDDKIYICDNKTSSSPYKPDDLTYSKQLATYAEYKQNPNVAYIVLEKKIRKTEPRTRTQILKGTLSEVHIAKTFADYEESLELIRNKVFAKNFEKCYNFFGGRCPYFKLCKNKNPEGLVKIEEKKNES